MMGIVGVWLLGLKVAAILAAVASGSTLVGVGGIYVMACMDAFLNYLHHLDDEVAPDPPDWGHEQIIGLIAWIVLIAVILPILLGSLAASI